MKQCERCGGMVLAFGEYTTSRICVCPTEPITTIQKQPFRCPVCLGRTTVPNDFYEKRSGTSNVLEICRSCNGTGIVWG